MKKLIITILALAAIALADKGTCTEVYNTYEFVKFSCGSVSIRTATLKISKSLDYITFVGVYKNGNRFYMHRTRESRNSIRVVSKVKDSYGIIAENRITIFTDISMEDVYRNTRRSFDFY